MKLQLRWYQKITKISLQLFHGFIMPGSIVDTAPCMDHFSTTTNVGIFPLRYGNLRSSSHTLSSPGYMQEKSTHSSTQHLVFPSG